MSARLEVAIHAWPQHQRLQHQNSYTSKFTVPKRRNDHSLPTSVPPSSLKPPPPPSPPSSTWPRPPPPPSDSHNAPYTPHKSHASSPASAAPQTRSQTPTGSPRRPDPSSAAARTRLSWWGSCVPARRRPRSGGSGCRLGRRAGRGPCWRRGWGGSFGWRRIALPIRCRGSRGRWAWWIGLGVGWGESKNCRGSVCDGVLGRRGGRGFWLRVEGVLSQDLWDSMLDVRLLVRRESGRGEVYSPGDRKTSFP